MAGRLYDYGPGQLNLRFTAGDDFSMTALIGGLGAATNHTWTAALAPEPGGTQTDFTVGTVTWVSDTNSVPITMTNGVTTSLSGRYLWQLQHQNASAQRRTLLWGEVTVVGQVES